MKRITVIALRIALFATATLSLFASAATAQPATASNKTLQGASSAPSLTQSATASNKTSQEASSAPSLTQPASVIVLRAARMLDVQTGRIVSPAVVVIEKGRIKCVNPATVPSGQVIDLGDVTLLPGPEAALRAVRLTSDS